MECKKKMRYDSLKPHLCEPCKTWIGHEKYMTSIECHKCGQVMKTI